MRVTRMPSTRHAERHVRWYVALIVGMALGTVWILPSVVGAQSDQQQEVSQQAATEQGPAVEVKLTGLEDAVIDDLIDNLAITKLQSEAEPDSADVRSAHRDSAEEIPRLLPAFGYYQATVRASLTRDDDRWIAEYVVDAGAPARIQELAIDIVGPGADEPEITTWRQSYPLKVGDNFNHQKYESSKQALTSIANNLGYFSAQYTTHEVLIDQARTRADVALRFETGPRAAVGEIKFVQDTSSHRFDEAFLRRFIEFREGAPFDGDMLANLQRRLSSSGYFQSVQVNPRYTAEVIGEVPIDVKLTARKPSLYAAGAGFGTDSGPRVNLSYERRQINAYGHRFSTGLRASEIENRFQAVYRVPLRIPDQEYLNYIANYIDEDSDARVRRTATIGVQAVDRIGAWQRTIGLTFEHERAFGDDLTGDTAFTDLLIPAIAFSRVQSDSEVFSKRGWRLSGSVRGALDDLVSDVSFLQANVNTKLIHALGPGRVIARAEVGATVSDSFSRLPPSIQFYTGGDQSVRGYAFDSIVPGGFGDDDGSTPGGENVVVGSLEYEYPIREDVSIAAFVDAGDSFNGSDIDIRRGIGLGLRWQLPFGAVRFDIAGALDRDGTPVRVHLMIGPDF